MADRAGRTEPPISDRDEIVAAIRTINKHHPLGDAVYHVRSHAVENDREYSGDSWHHPDVTEYSNAVTTLQKLGIIE